MENAPALEWLFDRQISERDPRLRCKYGASRKIERAVIVQLD
jgi:hypothetical protein